MWPTYAFNIWIKIARASNISVIFLDLWLMCTPDLMVETIIEPFTDNACSQDSSDYHLSLFLAPCVTLRCALGPHIGEAITAPCKSVTTRPFPSSKGSDICVVYTIYLGSVAMLLQSGECCTIQLSSRGAIKGLVWCFCALMCVGKLWFYTYFDTLGWQVISVAQTATCAVRSDCLKRKPLGTTALRTSIPCGLKNFGCAACLKHFREVALSLKIDAWGQRPRHKLTAQASKFVRHFVRAF